MNDFKLLKCLQNELVITLNKRIEYNNKNKNKEYLTYPSEISKARIDRLRLEIQTVMLRISNKLVTWKNDEIKTENWY